MAELQITCLGDFQVTLDGTALTGFRSDKVRALLVYLAIEKGVHQRTELVPFLWPGYSEESARNSLRQTLYQLRQSLRDAEVEPPWLLLTRQTVQSNPDAAIRVDVTAFAQLLAACTAHAHADLTTCAACLDRLHQAVDLYRGDFLGNFTVDDSASFEEWRRVTQEQLHIQMLDALTHLANAAERSGDAEGARRLAQRQLTLEPWLEAAHRQIMRTQAQRGQRAAALAQYNRCRQVLADELGVEPDDETTALYEQIRSGEFDKVTRRQGDKVTSDKVTSDKVTSDKVTSDKVTSDKVTESPLHPVTLSPLHPVTLSPPHPVTLSPRSAELTSKPHLVTPPHNLPRSPSPLVGREQALAELDALLQRPEARLVTLVGPGGMGKTRLAVEVGQRILDFGFRILDSDGSEDAQNRLEAPKNQKSKIKGLSWQEPKFPDGVWFVPLAAISTADGVPGAIASALGIALPGNDPHSALQQTLRQKQLLLILDNFEQLLATDGAAVDLVVDLLAVAPAVQILITSRERLKLREEQIYTVPALTFAPTASLAEAAASSAVGLFVQAIQRVHADFQLSAANLAVVLRICQLVQGMPLGLELAAANAGSAPLTAIADALVQSAEFLTVEWRDLPARQRSMRAVFAWSWRLLSGAEQRALRQCALFRGGFDYTAAQAVIGVTLPVLTRLVDKSLLQWQAAANGEGRYHLHELLRQFAAEELSASGEQTVAEEQHGRYYLAYLAARGLRLGRHEPKEASDEIRAEFDNVRQAWQWAATQGRLAELEQATYAWWQFCQFGDLEVEGRQSFAVAVAGVRARWLPTPNERAVGATDESAAVLLGQRLLAKLLAIHANYLFAQGSDEKMAAQAREAMQLGVASGGVEGETFGTFVLARALHELNQRRAAGDLWRQTIELVHTYQPTHPESELLHELHWMAYIWLRGSALHFGDYAGSRAYVVQALQLAQTLGKRRCELISLFCLGQTDFFLFDFARAATSLRAATDLARPLGYRQSDLDVVDGLEVMARQRGDYTTALRLLEQALTLTRELALAYDESFLLARLTRLHCQLGNQAAATQRYEQLTQLLARIHLPRECQLAAHLAAAFKAHYAGNAPVAHQFAEQAQQLIAQGEILFRQVDTALILGHVRTALGQWAGAIAAFQEALAAFQQFASARALAAEPQAGLAQVALAQGDLVGALAHVETILPILAEQPHAGFNNPFFLYLTCYRVLAATGDERADPFLQQGYALLQQDAAALDEESRQRFLTGVPLHRELAAAYTEMQKQ